MSEHYHATIRLVAVADTIPELVASIHLITARLGDLCTDAGDQLAAQPTAKAATVDGLTLDQAGAVAGIITRHTDPMEN